MKLSLTLRRSATALALIGTSACGATSLNETYGMTYRSFFQLQAADRPQTKDVAALKGEELRRILGNYYNGLGGGGGEDNTGASLPPLGQAGKAGGNPFALKAH